MSELFEGAEVIFSYTQAEAEADGYLTATATLLPGLARPPAVSHITCGVLALGYLREGGEANIPNLFDLLHQSLRVIVARLKANPEEYFVEMEIETPRRHKQKVWAQLNETGFFTLMLPEED